jgi:hypothetical protein
LAFQVKTDMARKVRFFKMIIISFLNHVPSPRDAVLLKTVYKSPATAHIFSFSADEPNLFPHIPPIEANTIRTQVDLQGFAIEALSPTTTLLTLLEQSDPKGWTNKTSIPQQMITTLAGIGEFAIKCGGPPIATRLAGAKATEIRYDHERSLFRIEYEVSLTSRRTLTSPVVANSSSEDGVNGSSSSSTPTPIVECELRCDMDTWAASLDIVVDPPPQSISCLRRHRLSSGGGGLWLTLTHDAVLAGEERLMAIVRRGPGRERGVVMLNGSKVSVDVEELPEAEIKSLSKQKRIKPPRIPLDQPPVLGAIRRRHRDWNGETEELSGDPRSPPSPTKAVEESGKSSTWSGAIPRLRSPLGRYFMQAMGQAATSTQQAVAAIAPPSTGDDSTSPSSEFPLQYALNALQYLQALHSRSSDPVSDGWTFISEKGFPLHRKLAPEISASLPVYRGERVIEGISAEEIAAVVTNYDARTRWDERFVGAHMLEVFAGAGGAHTAFTMNKAGFPFRDRGFYLASIYARGQREGRENDGQSPPLFCVSASFPSELASAKFTTTKYDPYGLPIGRMFIDGWILETLDPYTTTENYAIPSTRCTRVVAADYAGSLPAAVNAVTNTTLVKTLLSVEAYVKSIASLPFSRLPAAGVLLLVDKPAEAIPPEPNAWTLKRRDESRTLVQTRWTPDDRVYCGVVLLMVPAEPPALAPPITPTASQGSSSSGRQDQSKVAPSAAVPTLPPAPEPPTDLSASIMTVRPHSRSVSSSTATTTTSMRRRVASTAVAGGRSPSSERSLLRTTSSAFTVRGEVRQATDLLVAEVVVDSKLYPEGYHVRLRSRPHDANKSIPLLPATATAAPAAAEEQDGGATTPPGVTAGAETPEPPPPPAFLPLTYSVHTLPSSPLHSSGLAVDHPPRHLLRLILPTAQTQISTLLDPLTGETRAPPPKPQWMLDLSERGALIEIEIRPTATTHAQASGKVKTKGEGETVTIDDVVVKVEGEKESLTSLGREELQDDRVAWMAVLSRWVCSAHNSFFGLLILKPRRCSGEGESDELPAELRNAVAVADALLEPIAVSENSSMEKTEEEKEESTTSEGKGNEESASKVRYARMM